MSDAPQITADCGDNPPKRKPGRPKGSQNRVSRDAKELLASGAPAAIHRLLKIASGRTLYGSPGPGRQRTSEQPSVDQQLAAIKIIADRLLPVLKSAEITSDVTVGGDAFPDHHPGDLAKAMLGVLNAGRPPQASLPPLSVEPPFAMPTPEPAPEPQASIPAPDPEPEPELPPPLPSDGDGPTAARLRRIFAKHDPLGSENAFTLHVNKSARAL